MAKEIYIGLLVKLYRDLAGGLDFSYRWSCIGNGLRLQPVHQTCVYRTKSITK